MGQRATQANLSLLRNVRAGAGSARRAGLRRSGAGRRVEPLQSSPAWAAMPAAAAPQRTGRAKLLISRADLRSIDPFATGQPQFEDGFRAGRTAAAMGADVLLVEVRRRWRRPRRHPRGCACRGNACCRARRLPGMMPTSVRPPSQTSCGTDPSAEAEKIAGTPAISLVPTPDILAEVAMHASVALVVVLPRDVGSRVERNGKAARQESGHDRCQ